MLALSSDIARPGRLFRELIQHRKQTGSFSGDVDEYCRTVKSACEIGRVSHSTAMIPDGRWMQVVNQPLAEGGWVATIEERYGAAAVRRTHCKAGPYTTR